ICPMRKMTLTGLNDAEEFGVRGAFFLTKAVARLSANQQSNIWVVTRSAQQTHDGDPVEPAQAVLWGLGRTIALEHPRFWGGLIDLQFCDSVCAENEALVLVEELTDVKREDQLARRDGRRYVARLKRFGQQGHSTAGLRFKKDSTYLITGGLGMLGLNIAKYLVQERGVRFLVLTGRRAANENAQEIIAQLRNGGATVRVVHADMSIEADVLKVLSEIDAHMPPLTGVIHCAGLLSDGIIEQTEWDV